MGRVDIEFRNQETGNRIQEAGLRLAFFFLNPET